MLIRKGYIVVTTTNNLMNNNDCLVQTWRLFQFFLGRLAVRAWLEHYVLAVMGITVDVLLHSHMKLTKYTFNLLQHESINVFLPQGRAVTCRCFRSLLLKITFPLIRLTA